MAVLEFWKHRIVNFIFFIYYFFNDQQLAFENDEIRF